MKYCELKHSPLKINKNKLTIKYKKGDNNVGYSNYDNLENKAMHQKSMCSNMRPAHVEYIRISVQTVH